jgi:hypothetical protein
MTTEQGHRQLDKWRRQERRNKILVCCAIVFLVGLGVAGATFLLVKILKGPPTLTPSELVNEYSSWVGHTVRVKGRVKWLQGTQVRIEDDRGKSIFCHLLEEPRDLKQDDLVTVQGTVSSNEGLINCKLIE